MPDSSAVATSTGATVAPSGWSASLRLGFRRRDGATVLARREHHGPLRVQQPFYPEGEGVCHVIVVHPPGGIADGDTLEVHLEVDAGAAALATTPGAGKWYKSTGGEARQSVHLRVAAGGTVEWLPQENIVFDHARCRLQTRIELAPGASAMGREILCFGRSASGERFRAGQVGLDTTLTLGGRLAWVEKGFLDAASRVMSAPAGLGGRAVYAGFWAAGASVPPDLLAACRAVPTPDGEAGITVPGDVLVARYRGNASAPARRWTEDLWTLLRPHFAGRPAHFPRIWRT